MKQWGLVFDVEGDSLTPTKFHVMSCSDGNEISSTNNYDGMRKLLTETPVLVGHNIARWDIPWCEKVLDIKVPKETLIVDTLAVSWYLSPERKIHKLETY